MKSSSASQIDYRLVSLKAQSSDVFFFFIPMVKNECRNWPRIKAFKVSDLYRLDVPQHAEIFFEIVATIS